MGLYCSVCNRPDKDVIDKLIGQNVSLRDIEAERHVSRSALGRHRLNCLKLAKEYIERAQLRPLAVVVRDKNDPRDIDVIGPLEPKGAIERRHEALKEADRALLEEAGEGLDSQEELKERRNKLAQRNGGEQAHYLARAAAGIRNAEDALACAQLAVIEAGIAFHDSKSERMQATWLKQYLEGLQYLGKLKGWEPQPQGQDNRTVNVFANIKPQELLALASALEDTGA